MAAAHTALDIAVRVATLTQPHETTCGEMTIVRRSAQHVLIGIIDAIGRGAIAQRNAERAFRLLHEQPINFSLGRLFHEVHSGLIGTDGASITLCSISRDRIALGGIGTIDARSSMRRLPSVVQVGVVGGRCPLVRPLEMTLALGERIVLVSRGVASDVDLGRTQELPIPDACKHILHHHSRRNDDATVLIAEARAGL